jgi:hypothetical protein
VSEHSLLMEYDYERQSRERGRGLESGSVRGQCATQRSKSSVRGQDKGCKREEGLPMDRVVGLHNVSMGGLDGHGEGEANGDVKEDMASVWRRQPRPPQESPTQCTAP